MQHSLSFGGRYQIRIMVIDKKILDSLSAQAKANPRLRQGLDMRNTKDDSSQRLLNAMEPGTIMPIHRHRTTSETMVIIRGKLVERFYDNEGNLTDEYMMEPMGKYPMIQVSAGQWHALEVLASGTVIFEAKDGKYEPLAEDDIMQYCYL